MTNQQGVTLIEVLFALVLAGILSVAIAMNTVTGLRTAKMTELNHAASRLASDKMEQLASVDSMDLDDTYDTNESALSYAGLATTFRRITNVTVNADSSKTIDVQVSANSTSFPASVDFSTTFALWE